MKILSRRFARVRARDVYAYLRSYGHEFARNCDGDYLGAKVPAGRVGIKHSRFREF